VNRHRLDRRRAALERDEERVEVELARAGRGLGDGVTTGLGAVQAKRHAFGIGRTGRVAPDTNG
jgi:hypothetical protein